MVYYRKYRPQIIGDLDSAKLRETLHAVLSGKNVPHAFLFTGPKGLGKTSTARIVAKVVNCEHQDKKLEERNLKLVNETGNLKIDKKEIKHPASSINKPASSIQPQASMIEPDNTCDQCVSITNGTNIDVLEIDGASNRGIDEIRELRERVNLAPSSAKKKVYIIDEVHMLTTEAFNALLKTIEEPPSHVMFVFCTTEPHKVPATILSRCFHISFQLATEDEIVHSLERIVKAEKLEIEKEVLHMIAQLAEGGFRDATKMLEEIVSLAGKKTITKAFFEEKYHVSSITYYVSGLLEFLSQKKTKEALQLVQEIKGKGIDIKYFMGQLLEVLHLLLLEKAGVITGEKNVHMEIEEITDVVSLISEAYQQLKFAVIPQLPLEIAIIQYISSSSEESSREVVPVDNQFSTSHTLRSNNTGKHTMDTLLKKQQVMKVKAMLGKAPEEKSLEKKDQGKEVHQNDISSKPDDLTSLYENIIYKVKPYNHSVAGVLRSCKIKEINESTIIFETSYKFHKERLEEKKTCEIIEKAVREVTGKELKISVILKK